MLSIKVDLSGMKAIATRIDAHNKQVRYAAAVALTRTAKIAQAEVEKRITRDLDRPTSYAKRMMFIKPATKNKLESMVYVKDNGTVQKSGLKSQADVLGHLFSGGKRLPKNSELMLIRAGIMRSGEMAVPGSSVQLDAYGNFPRGLLIQLLAYFKTFGESGYKANMSDKSASSFERRMGKKLAGANISYFISDGSSKKGKKLHRGIWQRVGFGAGVSIRPVMMFVPAVAYRKYFELHAIVDDVAHDNFKQQFNSAYAEAMRSAR